MKNNHYLFYISCTKIHFQSSDICLQRYEQLYEVQNNIIKHKHLSPILACKSKSIFPTSESFPLIVSNFNLILDGFISGCMEIYCTRQECISHSAWLVGYAFLTHTVYSHTTLNAIQHYITIARIIHIFIRVFSISDSIFGRLLLE